MVVGQKTSASLPSAVSMSAKAPRIASLLSLAAGGSAQDGTGLPGAGR